MKVTGGAFVCVLNAWNFFIKKIKTKTVLITSFTILLTWWVSLISCFSWQREAACRIKNGFYLLLSFLCKYLIIFFEKFKNVASWAKKLVVCRNGRGQSKIFLAFYRDIWRYILAYFHSKYLRIQRFGNFVFWTRYVLKGRCRWF